MKKNQLSITLFLVFGLFSNFYSQNLEWAFQYEGLYDQESMDVLVDNSGNVYSTGWFSNTVDFDPSSSVSTQQTSANRAIYVSKHNSNGNLIWAKKVGNGFGNYNQAYSVYVDQSSNVYVTGYFQGTEDFNPDANAVYNLTSQGLYDIFVLKLDSSGNFIWAKGIGGSSADIGYAVAADNSGVYVTGRFQGTVDFNPGSTGHTFTSSGIIDAFLLKLNTNGDFLWAYAFGGLSVDIGESVELDSQGNLLALYRYSGNVDFDPSANNVTLNSVSGSYDMAITKFSSSGNLIWAKSMGGTSTEEPSELIIDSNDNILSTGYFSGTADFDPGAATSNLTATGSFSVFVSKLDSNGNFVWAKAIKSTANVDAKGIAVDNNNNVYIGGMFEGTTDFNPDESATFNLTSNGDDDVFVTKLNSNGDFGWAISAGGTGLDLNRGIAVDVLDNSIYNTGAFSSTVDFDPATSFYNLTSAGGKDIFIQKISDSGSMNVNESVGVLSQISIYPNPVVDYLMIKNMDNIDSITIFDVTGKLIFNKKGEIKENLKIDFSAYKKGIYFLKLVHKNEVKNFKILKN